MNSADLLVLIAQTVIGVSGECAILLFGYWLGNKK